MPDRSRAPEVRPFGFRTLPSDSVERLRNGATLHTLRGGTQAVGQMTMLFAGGTHDMDNPTVCAMASSLVSEGAGGYSGAEIADRLDFSGAMFMPHSSAHYTGFGATVLTHRLPDILPLFKAMAEAPDFSDRSIENNRRLLSARLRMDEAKVMYRAATAFRRLVYGPGHPQAHVRTLEEIEGTGREELQAFHASLVRPEGLHVYLAGGFGEPTVDAVKKFLLSLEAPDPAAMPIARRDEKPAPEAPQTVFEEMEGAVQTAVCAGMPAINRTSADFIGLRMAVMALGGYFGSRLMTNIREEKGLTYNIDAFLSAQHDGAAVNIQAQCNSDNVREVVDEIRRELRDMAENPPSGRELERLKLTAMTGLVETLDSPLSISGYRQLELVTGTPRDYFEAQQRVISELTPELLAEMSARYLRPEELRIAIAGPRRSYL